MTDGDGIGVFLSGVSSEFEQARSLVASDLRSKRIETRVQEDFNQGQDKSTLERLHTYISGCETVVGMVGRRSGAMPPPRAMMRFEEIWPEQFDQLSYTQWEIVFALSLEKKLLLYEASVDYQPDRDEPVTDDDAELQADFTAWLWGDGEDSLGRNRSAFSNRDELGRMVLREPWEAATASGDRRTATPTEHGADAGESRRPKIERRLSIVTELTSRAETVVGRGEELGELETFLGRNHRLIQIVGRPGIGKKTLLAELQPEHSIRPDREDLGNPDDLLQSTWEQLYQPDKSGVVSLRAPDELARFDGFILAPDIDPFRDEIVQLSLNMPQATFLTTSTEELDRNAVSVPLDGLTEPKDMFALFQQQYLRAVPDPLVPEIEKLCERLGGNPSLIVQLAKDARLTRPVTQWVEDRVQLSPEALHATLMPDEETRTSADASAAVGDSIPIPSAVLMSVTSSEAVDSALDRGQLLRNSPRYHLNPVLDADGVGDGDGDGERGQALMGEVFDASLDWCKSAGTTEIIENRPFVVRMMEWAADNELWSGVLQMGAATEMAMALGGRQGAWDTILQRYGLAAEKKNDRVAQGKALHQLGTRALLRDQLGDARVLLRRALGFRRDAGSEAVALTRQNLRLIPGAVISIVGVVAWLAVGLLWIGAVGAAAGLEDAGRPIADLSPDFWTFESVEDELPITLENLGDASFEVAPIQDVDGFVVVAEDDGCSDTTLEEGENCEFTVVFVGSSSDPPDKVYAGLLNVTLVSNDAAGDSGILLVGKP